MNLIAFIQARRRLLLVGPPGLAKTARILAAAIAAGHKLVTMRASLAERPDLGGCLVPDMEQGGTRALPLEMLARLRAATEPTILFLDDLGQAPMDVQSACMSLFDPGALPDCVLIWGATNRPGDKAGVTSLCEPLRSRFHLAFSIATPDAKPDSSTVTLGTWKEEVDRWCDWACGNAQPFAPEIIAWHRSTTGRTLYQWKPCADPAVRMADFRSWETVGHLWNAGLRELDVLSAAVGRAVAGEFLAFASLASELPSPTQVWMDPTKTPVPDHPGAQYLIASMLGRAVEPQYVPAFLAYIDRLPRVQGAYAASDAFKRLGAAKLTGNATWQKWWTKNKGLFATGTA